MVDATRFAMRLSHDLAGVTDRKTWLEAINESLNVLLPADSIGWVGGHHVTHHVEIQGTGDSGRPEVTDALTRTWPRHPMVGCYVDKPHDPAPRRIGDLLSPLEWKSHEVYHEVFIPLGAIHQLTVLVDNISNGWNGWGFNRAGRDFTDDELELATRLQPMLRILNHLSCLLDTRLAVPDRDAAQERAGLTHRELEILQNLADGFSARAIAGLHRISERTVRKHLEHIYTKLGNHDRLSAVTHAARLGLVTLTADSTPPAPS